MNCNGRVLDLSVPRVMGILNITPDSFSDGGNFFSAERAIEHARAMVADGAAIIDVGGESTRPGSDSVPVQEELRRVVPIIEALASELPVPISIDTCKPEVMAAAVRAGAGFINDIEALQAPGALRLAAELGVPVCLMHMQGKPRTMQANPQYRNVVDEVRDFLLERAEAAVSAGVPRHNIVLDPGFGFGKALEHNCQLLKKLDVLAAEGYPVLVGMSRKSMIARILDRPTGDRLYGSVGARLRIRKHCSTTLRRHGFRPHPQNPWIPDSRPTIYTSI